MKLLYSILLTISALTGCAKKQADTAPVTMTKQDTAAAVLQSYLALGDSYTIGEAVPDTQSYPYQLAAQLNTQKFSVKKPTIIAVTGWTTDNLISAIANS